MRYHPEIEHKFACLDAPLSLSEGAVISGYASRFAEVDQGGDQVMPGAYGGSLAQLEATGRKVKMLWQHDPAQPIGVWDTVREDDTGLWVSGRLLTETRRGAEAATLIAAGALDGLSIGYRTKRAARDDAGHRCLHEVELWEVSLVTFPMLPTARVATPADGKADPVADPQADPLAESLRQLTLSLRSATDALTSDT